MKKTFRPKYILPLTLISGLVGCAMQIWLQVTGPDAKGLLRTDHPAIVLCYLLTAATLGGMILCLRPVCGKYPYRGLFAPSALSSFGCWAFAAGILFTVLTASKQTAQPLSAIDSLLGLSATVSLLVLGICRLKGVRPNPAWHTLVTVYLMFHLICQYRFWSSETQLSAYFFPLMASVFLMLGTYYQATLDAGSHNVKAHLFFRYGALFFCCLCAGGQLSLLYICAAVWCALSGCSFSVFDQADHMHLPAQVTLCLEKLNDAGFEAYVVGGCVRDALLELQPQDYDLCTNATPSQICRVFCRYRLVRNGEKHGTIGIVMDDQLFEITTFRTESGYSDSRHPDRVRFVNDVTEDLARRDFTVNAMAYSPICGYVDPFGGCRDLAQKLLRTVGDPTERFQEDALRILRGVRFAARYRLTCHPDTEQAMLRLADTMDSLARERVFEELSKFLVWAEADDLLRHAPILIRVIPELAATVDFAQHSPYHSYDVYTHTAHVVSAVAPELPLRLAALLHDVGKPTTFTLDGTGRGHFYGHAAVSAEIADAVLQRLRAPNELRQQVVFLIQQHMLCLEPEKKQLRRTLSKFGADNLKQLLQLQQADFCSKGSPTQSESYAQIGALVEEILSESECLQLRDLAVNGNDLMALGFSPDSHLGDTLARLLEMVLDEQLPNERQALLSAAAAMGINKEETK